MTSESKVLSRSLAMAVYRGKGNSKKLAAAWVNSVRCVRIAREETLLLGYANQAINSAIRHVQQGNRNLVQVLQWRDRLEKSLPTHLNHAKRYSGEPLEVWMKHEKRRLENEIKRELEKANEQPENVS